MTVCIRSDFLRKLKCYIKKLAISGADRKCTQYCILFTFYLIYKSSKKRNFGDSLTDFP